MFRKSCFAAGGGKGMHGQRRAGQLQRAWASLRGQQHPNTHEQRILVDHEAPELPTLYNSCKNVPQVLFRSSQCSVTFIASQVAINFYSGQDCAKLEGQIPRFRL